MVVPAGGFARAPRTLAPLELVAPLVTASADDRFVQLIALAARGDVAGVTHLATELAPQLLAAPLPLPAPGRPYGRRILHVADHGEVLLMRWRSDAVSAIHDHGGAAGVVVALAGELSEDTIDLVGEGVMRSRLARRLPRGGAIQVGADGFHLMRAPLGGVSLHVYTPRPRGMQIADPSARCVWHVDDNHGAWLPVEPARVVGVSPWPSA